MSGCAIIHYGQVHLLYVRNRSAEHWLLRVQAIAAHLPHWCRHERRLVPSPVLSKSQILCARSLLFGSCLQRIISCRLGPTCNTMQVHKDRVLTRSKQREQVMTFPRETWKEVRPFKTIQCLLGTRRPTYWRAAIRLTSCETGCPQSHRFFGALTGFLCPLARSPWPSGD